MLHFLAEVVLCRLLHLGQDHGGHLLWGHLLGLSLNLHTDLRLAVLVDDVEGQELDVLLHCGVLEASADQALHVEEGLGGVDRRLVLGGLTDETLVLGEGDIGGSNSVSLVVGNDLYPAILVDADTGVRGSQVDSDHWAIDLLLIILGHSGAGKP
mmetsp:Transcript_79271/g.173885  ORF Transcript_79271/g.173885 Transcript_79271/m.173885 type:complete len:155 (+) Transcript_79271:1770-2234(+)